MGISVIATLSPSLPPPGVSTGTDGLTPESDFAALFVEQLSASIAGMLPTDKAATALTEVQGLAAKGNKDEGKDLPPADASLITDPSLLNFVPPVQAVEPQKIESFAPPQVESANESLISELSNGRLNASLLEGQGKELAQPEATPLAAESKLDTLTNREQKTTDKFSAILSSLRDSGNSTPSLANSASPISPGQYAPAEAANFAVDTSATETGQPTLAGIAASTPKQVPVHEIQNASNLHIPASIHGAEWAHSLGEKVVWLAKNDQQTAQININPPQLGPMQISLNLNGDQATAIFASPHAEVRQAIEDAMPRLREMLSSTGISLGDANVGAQLPQQNRENAAQFTNTPPNGGRFADENAILAGDGKAANSSGTLPIQRGRGLVDLFA